MLAVGILLGVSLLLASSPPVSERLGYTPPFGTAELFAGGHVSADIELHPVPRPPTVKIVPAPLYAPNDPWRAWLADERTCPGGEDTTIPPEAQLEVMLCLVNFARAQEGLEPLVLSEVLNESAAAKARDIVSCREFSHEACGRQSNQTLIDVGYHGSWGENLYAAEGPLVAPRPALDGWLNSRGHRENLFRTEWRTIGIALLAGAELGRVDDGVVWVNHFGD
jgi:uncharacterized protein YkwD